MPKLGYKQTEAHRAAISAGVRGKEIPELSRERMRQAHLGQVFTLETRQKMSAAKRGKKQTEELVERRMAGRRAAAERRALARDSSVPRDGMPPQSYADIMRSAREALERATVLRHESHAAQARVTAALAEAKGRLTLARDQLAKHRARGVAVISAPHRPFSHTASA